MRPEINARKTLTGGVLIAAIFLGSAPAWAQGALFDPMSRPGDFVAFWLLATISIGWIGSLWTLGLLGLLWFRHRIRGWRLAAIALVGAPALGLAAVFLGSDTGLSSSNLTAIGLAAIYQTGYSLIAYGLHQNPDVVDD